MLSEPVCDIDIGVDASTPTTRPLRAADGGMGQASAEMEPGDIRGGHAEDAHVCPDCSRAFSSSPALKVHQRMRHSRRRRGHAYVIDGRCPACGGEYRTRIRCLEHLERGSARCHAMFDAGKFVPHLEEVLAAADAADRAHRRAARAAGDHECAGLPARRARRHRLASQGAPTSAPAPARHPPEAPTEERCAAPGEAADASAAGHRALAMVAEHEDKAQPPRALVQTGPATTCTACCTATASAWLPRVPRERCARTSDPRARVPRLPRVPLPRLPRVPHARVPRLPQVPRVPQVGGWRRRSL